MPKITFIEHNGTEHCVDAEVGQTLMQVAMNNMIQGIIGDCGGNCACGTCHIYIDPSWEAKVPPPEPGEKDMIECTLYPQENSRLSCQVAVTPQLDGLVVLLPESQI